LIGFAGYAENGDKAGKSGSALESATDLLILDDVNPGEAGGP
jgi:hypothetical protein